VVPATKRGPGRFSSAKNLNRPEGASKMEPPDRHRVAAADAGDKKISVTRARQAVSPRIVRYVLGIGLVLAVLALGLTLALGGL
jgi:hypothetical protein